MSSRRATSVSSSSLGPGVSKRKRRPCVTPAAIFVAVAAATFTAYHLCTHTGLAKAAALARFDRILFLANIHFKGQVQLRAALREGATGRPGLFARGAWEEGMELLSIPRGLSITADDIFPQRNWGAALKAAPSDGWPASVQPQSLHRLAFGVIGAQRGWLSERKTDGRPNTQVELVRAWSELQLLEVPQSYPLWDTQQTMFFDAVWHLRSFNHPPGENGAKGWPRFRTLAAQVSNQLVEDQIRDLFAVVASRAFEQRVTYADKPDMMHSTLHLLIDLVNHDMHPNVAIKCDGSSSSLVATRAISDGEELLMSYGHRSNLELLHKHGFTLGEENQWGLAIQIKHCEFRFGPMVDEKQWQCLTELLGGRSTAEVRLQQEGQFMLTQLLNAPRNLLQHRTDWLSKALLQAADQHVKLLQIFRFPGSNTTIG